MKVCHITKLPKAVSGDRLKVILCALGWATTPRLDVDVSNLVKANVIPGAPLKYRRWPPGRCIVDLQLAVTNEDRSRLTNTISHCGTPPPPKKNKTKTKQNLKQKNNTNKTNTATNIELIKNNCVIRPKNVCLGFLASVGKLFFFKFFCANDNCCVDQKKSNHCRKASYIVIYPCSCKYTENTFYNVRIKTKTCNVKKVFNLFTTFFPRTVS